MSLRLSVNVAAASGKLQVEVLDKNNKVISGFDKNSCKTLTVDSTIAAVEWNGKKDLSELAGTPVRFRFILENGDLYSFWVSPSLKGESNGYVAGGGPGYTSNIDTVGKDAYTSAVKLK